VHEESATLRIRDNPFYVLGLRPDATRVEIERQGAKLLGMLELKLKSALTYPTPLGRSERTADKVRQAMAELRDPERRLGHELWARLDPQSAPPEGSDATPPEAPRPKADEPWSEALTALGWLGHAGKRPTEEANPGSPAPGASAPGVRAP
jgi:hypothetical protein